MSTQKPLLKSKVTTHEVPARTVEKEVWECTCGLEFQSYDDAKLHYGKKHAADRSIEIRDCTFYLISSQSNFDCWKTYRRHVYGNHRLVTKNEWDGPGWYCSRADNYGRYSGSVWDGEHSIVKAKFVLAEWQNECDRLQAAIDQGQSAMSTSKPPKKEPGPTGPLDSGGF